jgi:hypothetical protein
MDAGGSEHRRLNYLVSSGRNHARAHRVEDHVSGQLEQIGLLLDQDRLVAPLEDVTDPPVDAVEPLCIDTVELPLDSAILRKIADTGLDVVPRPARPPTWRMTSASS